MKLWKKTQNSNCDKTKKPKLWQTSQTQIVLKHKNSNCDNSKAQITINLKLWPNLKTQVLKMWEKIKKKKLRQNSTCIKTQNLKYGQKSKTWIVTKLKLWQISIHEGKN